jgi:hypothetical protein
MMIIIYICVVALNVADYITTRVVLSHGGRELNPIMRWIIDGGLFIPAKIILTGIIISGLYFTSASFPVITIITGWAIVIYYAWVVLHNLSQIFMVGFKDDGR